jgi:Transport and Golgi organisation 2
MCTVTFIPGPDGVYLTSNRDERLTRPDALFPFRATLEGQELIYPKDAEAGGTWIALKSGGDAAVLLNGAFTKHRRQPTYRKSRGLVFLDIVRSADPAGRFEKMDLTGIEPFTLVLFCSALLFECRWDGERKHMARLSSRHPYIWSSATLYSAETSRSREEWFRQWYAAVSGIGTESILGFHRTAGSGDAENGLIIDRQGKIVTRSITSIRLAASRASIRYVDIRAGREYSEDLALKPNAFSFAGLLRGRLAAKLRIRLIRLRNWEYWPFALVYLPIFVYWVWLSIKAKSFFFFSTANPSIQNAGFLLESKKQIYELLPDEVYPKTIFCRKGSAPADICPVLAEKGMAFPLMAKPDIGQRGLQVRLLRNECELRVYAARSRVDFLVQEYIDYPNEAGIFYYRLPGETKGRISGVVGKEMLKVTGDGRSTVEALVLQKDRHVLQLKVLRATYGAYLKQVLPAGEEQVLVPYGNHSRGAKFLDWTDRVTPALQEHIDVLCRRVTGFYFGRLDIKFSNWEALCSGKGYSVIELNGAGSEPTHIYDPSHSIFFAWKEIIRHLRLLYVISRANARRDGLEPMGTRAGLKMLRDYARHEKLIS